MPGSLAERLFELPEDADIIASLLRIALQARVATAPIPEAVLAEGRWAMVGSLPAARDCEKAWLGRLVVASDLLAPGRWLAGRLVVGLAPGLMRRGVRALTLSASGLLLAVGATVLAGLGLVVCGLGAFAVASCLLEAALVLRRIERRGDERMALMRWLLDAALVVLLALALPGDWPGRLFAPLIVVGLANLLPALTGVRWVVPAKDRAVLAVLLALAASFAGLQVVLQGLAVVLLGLALFVVHRTGRLTGA